MNAIIQLFNRDISKLEQEISLFNNEKNLWEVRSGIENSSGNLCLHLIGNLNHFIGSLIGESGYVRDRKSEFENKNVSKDELLKMITKTREVVEASLQHFDKNSLKSIYPIRVFEEEMSYEFFLIHLISHLNYHLGQINYLRRILEN